MRTAAVVAALACVTACSRGGEFVYVYTCGGDVGKVDLRTLQQAGQWDVAKLLPEELRVAVRDGCLLNWLKYDKRSGRLLTIVPKEATLNEQGKRHYRIVAFELPEMRYAGTVDLDAALAIAPGIAPGAGGGWRVLYELDGGAQFEIGLDARTPQWLDAPRVRGPEPAPSDRPAAVARDWPSLEGKNAAFVCQPAGDRVSFYSAGNRLWAVRLPDGAAQAIAAEGIFDKTSACVTADR